MKLSIKNSTRILLALLLFSCNSHYILKEAKADIPPITLKKNLSVVFVGFLPYKVTSAGRTYTATVNRSQRIQLSEKIGKPAENFKVKGIRKDIPPEKVKAFAETYINAVKKSGIEEVMSVVQVSKEDPNAKESTIQLKDLGADYYVLGILSPAFQESNIGLTFIHVLTHLFSMVTVGLIPSLLWSDATTKVLVYDKNLNQVWSKEYDSSYFVYRAVWASPNPKGCQAGSGCDFQQFDSVPAFAFKPVLPELESDLVQFLNSK
ncbi:hypothetical protein LEP1GSC058_1319 [Leptospira fainei serovar Hurstbridge str. BUT 6]|uniref:Lipoprotein n=1 Tax=Leptospira fainei serovar Hurstbridge str. BUT 6 TaxID=1193011 RepID=S3V6J8_9LEPT|nr:hypothetical protein LEP1GSC058_1319 [Leptospira fainei serovar Hurstbridge str. BUT 6]